MSRPLARRRAPYAVLLALLTLLALASPSHPTHAVPPPAAAPSSSAAMSSTPPSSAGRNFTAGTYNILASFHVAAGRRIGGPVKARAARAISTIRRTMDIAGLQEMTPYQRRVFDRGLPGYDAVPARRPSTNTVYVRSSRFRVLATGRFGYPGFLDRGLRGRSGDGVWARLADRRTGRVVFVLNDHLAPRDEHPRGGSDRGGARKRLVTARLELARVRAELRDHPSEVVVDLGDKNSTNNLRNHRARMAPVPKDPVLHGRRGLLPYCVLTAGPAGRRPLRSAYDLVRGRAGHCPTRAHSRVLDLTVDWVYVSPATATATRWRRPSTWSTRHASDHLPVIATIAYR